MTHQPKIAVPMEDGDRPVTFDQLDTTTYLYADTKPDTSFTEHMILQVNGLELHGAPVTVPAQDHDHDRGANDRHEQGNHDEGLGKSVTFDQFDTTTFVHTDIAADDSFRARFILQVDGFELNHSPVTLPGFGTHYGMYFLIDATGTAPTVGPDTFTSMNVALMVDPHNNDGTLSASPDGIGFAKGTADDFALLTGTLKTAGITFDGNVGHPSFFENVALTEAGEKVFGADFDPGAVLHEFLTTPGGPNNLNVPGGGIEQWVNGTGHAGGAATAIVTLDPQAPLSIRPALLNHDPHCGPIGG